MVNNYYGLGGQSPSGSSNPKKGVSKRDLKNQSKNEQQKQVGKEESKQTLNNDGDNSQDTTNKNQD